MLILFAGAVPSNSEQQNACIYADIDSIWKQRERPRYSSRDRNLAVDRIVPRGRLLRMKLGCGRQCHVDCDAPLSA